MRRSFTFESHWPVRLLLGATCAAALAAAPGVARADSLLYAKSGQIWIAHSDGSSARQVTSSNNNWAWPSMADDGTVWAAGGLSRINGDGSDSDGSDTIYHLDQSGNQLDTPAETYGSHSTPACPTYAPWNVRVAPNGTRVSYNLFFCDNMDSFYMAPSGQYKTLISEDYEVNNWIDSGHILMTHEGATFGNAAFAEYDIMDPGSSHGPSDDPYLPDYEAASSRSGNRVAVYEDDPLIDGSGVAQADIRLYATNNGDVTDVVEKCTIPLTASTATTTVGASLTFSPDGTRLAWGAKDGIHHANTANLEDCSTVGDQGVLVPGGAQPFFGPADVKPAVAPAPKPGPSPSPSPVPTVGPDPQPGPNTPLALASPTRKAKLSAKGVLEFKLTASRSGSARVTGSVKLGHRALRFAARKVSLTGGRVSKVAIKLPKGDARRVRAALKKHAKLTARLTVAMTAAAGDSRTLKLAIRLR